MYLILVTVAGLSGIWHGPSRKGWWLKRAGVMKMPLHWQMIRATNTWWLFFQRQYTNCSDITGIFIFVWRILMRQITACPSVLLPTYLSVCLSVSDAHIFTNNSFHLCIGPEYLHWKSNSVVVCGAGMNKNMRVIFQGRIMCHWRLFLWSSIALKWGPVRREVMVFHDGIIRALPTRVRFLHPLPRSLSHTAVSLLPRFSLTPVSKC